MQDITIIIVIIRVDIVGPSRYGSKYVQFFLSFAYICIAVGDAVIKTRGWGISLTDLIPLLLCACPNLGAGFPRLKVTFVLWLASSFEMRGDSSFC